MTAPFKLPENQFAGFLNGLKQSEFTRKLSYEEQEALTAEQFSRYCDWLFGVNEKKCVARERRDNPSDGISYDGDMGRQWKYERGIE